MADYRDYISFELTPEIQDLAERPTRMFVPASLRSQVERALAEIAQTPEGARLLQEAAAQSADGKVNIMYNRGGGTIMTRSNDIFIGTEDSRVQYFSPETGEYHDISLQNMIYHELSHIVRDHEKPRGDEDKHGMSRSKEIEAVADTNIFMRKYYGEPMRDEADPYNARLENGTRAWDFNPNFDPSGFGAIRPENLRASLSNMTAPQAAELGPEMESLYQFRNRPERFARELQELKNNGSGDELAAAVARMEQTHSAQPAAKGQPDLNAPATQQTVAPSRPGGP